MTNNNENPRQIPPAYLADYDQASRTIEQLAEWAHLDAAHGEDHGAEAVALVEGMTKKQLGAALIVAAWAFARLVPATCEGEGEAP